MDPEIRGHRVRDRTRRLQGDGDRVSTRSADGKTVWLHCMPDKASPKYGMWMQAHDRILAATDLVTGEPVSFEQKDVKGKSMLLMTLSIPDGVPDYVVRLDVEPLPADRDPPR